MNRFLKACIFLIIAGTMALPVQAIDWSCVVPPAADTLWSTGTNWTPAGPPIGTDDVYINDTDVTYTSYTGTYDIPLIDATVAAVANTVYLGTTVDAELDMTGGSLITNVLRIGNVPGTSVFNLSGGTVTKNTGASTRFGWSETGGTGCIGRFIMSDGQFDNVSSNFLLGYNAGNAGYLDMSGGTVNQSGVQLTVGYTATGDATLSSNAVWHQLNGAIAVGFANGTGTLTVKDNAAVIVDPYNPDPSVSQTPKYYTCIGQDGGTGTFYIQDNAQFMSAELLAGQNVDAVGTVNMTGGSVTLITSKDWGVDPNLYWPIEAVLDIGRWGGTGHMTVSGGTLEVNGRTNIGNGDNFAGVTSHGDLTLEGYATMNTSTGFMRNYGWGWIDGGDVYVGCAEWDNGVNGRTQTEHGGVGSLTIKDFAQLNIPTGNWRVGIDGGTGTLVMSDDAYASVNYDLIVGIWSRDLGAGWEGNGTAVIGNGTDSPTLVTGGELRSGDSGHGTITLNSGSITVGTHFRVGYNGYADSEGYFNMNGGNITVGGWVQVGNNDGGANGAGAGGVFNMNDGTFWGGDGGIMLIGRGITGTWNQNGGATSINTVACLGNRGYTGTLNLNGGTFAVDCIQMGYENDTNAPGVINFNGGSLQANTVGPYTTNTTGFFISKYFSKVAQLRVQAGGAVIDTNGYDCKIGGDTWGDLPLLHDPALGGTQDGGLTKIGGGTLLLTGANTYDGPTTVSEGGLTLQKSGSLATTSIALADGTTFDLGKPSGLTSVLDSMTMGTGTTLKVALPETSVGPEIDVRGTGGVLSLPTGGNQANVVISAAGSSLAGSYTLFKATSIPDGLAANLNVTLDNIRGTVTATDIGDPGIGLTITTDQRDLIWRGTTDSVWDASTGTQNWVYGSPEAASDFRNLDSVTFDDSGSPAPIVTLTGTLHPVGDITVTGVTSYEWAGDGTITGDGTTLTKTGTGTLTISNTAGNTFTGDVSITEGSVVLNQKGGLGVGNTVTVDGGLTSLSVNGNFMGQNSSKSLNVTGGATVTISGELVCGYTAGDPAVNVTDSNLTVSGGSRYGYRGGSATLNLTNSTYIYGAHITVGDSEGWGPSTAVVNMDASTILGGGSQGPMYIGLRSEAVGTINMINGSQINTSGVEICIAYNDGYGGAIYAPAIGTINMHDTSNITNTSGSISSYGEQGTLNMYDDSTVDVSFIQVGSQNMNSALTINLQDNTTVTAGDYVRLAYWGGVPGTYSRLTIDGSGANPGVNNFNCPGIFYVGWQWGNYPNASTERGDNAVTVTGDNANVNAGTIVLGSRAGQGAWNQEGGVTTSTGTVVLGQYDSDVWPEGTSIGGGGGIGILNLNGGTFKAPQFSTDSGTTSWTDPDTNITYPVLGGNARGTVNFNGGKLVVTGATGDLFAMTGLDSAVTLNVMKNGMTGLGAVIDTQANNVTINQPLQNGTGGGADGGLTKLGAGTLTLTSDPTYTGPTDIQEGLLQLNSPTPALHAIVSTTAVGDLGVGDGVAATDASATRVAVRTLTVAAGSKLTIQPHADGVPGAEAAGSVGDTESTLSAPPMPNSLRSGKLPAAVLATDIPGNLGVYNAYPMDIPIANPIAIPATPGPTPVPEPSTFVLLALAGLGVLLAAWRRR